MKILTSLYDVSVSGSTAVAVGKFDGMHKGHELLMEKLLEQEKTGLSSVIVTFDVSPRVLLKKDLEKYLITNEERVEMLRHEGISCLVQCSFANEIKNLEPEEFIRLLVQNLHMKYMVCGTDFRFGRMGRGDAALLKQLAKTYDFTLEVVDKLQFSRRDISSTYIREEIAAGNVAAANALLGYPYFIWGVVTHGRQLGRQYRMPTINIYPSKEKLLPANGVYITEVDIDHRIYHGVTNVGVKPSVGDHNIANVETHILDFSRDIYEKQVKITFLEHIRPERKFATVDELFRQMERDKKTAREYFNRKGKTCQ